MDDALSLERISERCGGDRTPAAVSQIGRAVWRELGPCGTVTYFVKRSTPVKASLGAPASGPCVSPVPPAPTAAWPPKTQSAPGARDKSCSGGTGQTCPALGAKQNGFARAFSLTVPRWFPTHSGIPSRIPPRRPEPHQSPCQRMTFRVHDPRSIAKRVTTPSTAAPASPGRARSAAAPRR